MLLLLASLALADDNVCKITPDPVTVGQLIKLANNPAHASKVAFGNGKIVAGTATHVDDYQREAVIEYSVLPRREDAITIMAYVTYPKETGTAAMSEMWYVHIAMDGTLTDAADHCDKTKPLAVQALADLRGKVPLK